MATLDYKIVSVVKNRSNYTLLVRVYRGAVTTEAEPGLDGPVDVTRYRRNAMVGARRFTFTSDMTPGQIRKWLNRKIRQRAESLGHTIADFQANTAGDEQEVDGFSVSNLTDDAA